jgi:hypothetical protein
VLGTLCHGYPPVHNIAELNSFANGLLDFLNPANVSSCVRVFILPFLSFLLSFRGMIPAIMASQSITGNEKVQDATYIPSILHGPAEPPLVTVTLGRLLDLQCRRYGHKECLVISWTGARWSYNHLREQSSSIAKMLLDVGIRQGDRIGIMAGNCEQYVSVLFAAVRVGAILVVLNNTYTAAEALRALRHTGMYTKHVFIDSS